MRINEIIHFYDVDKIYKDIKLGKLYPKHHIWCYDSFKEKGYYINNVWTLKHLKLPRFLIMNNLIQQIKCIKESKNADLIFSPFLFDVYFIALLKALKLYRKPLVAIAQDTWDIRYSSSKINKLNLLFHRWIAKNGVDKLLFISENVYKYCSEYFNDTKQAFSLKHWGVDLSYYDLYLNEAPILKNYKYFFMTGGSNRDLDIIINAANETSDLNILIQTKKLGKLNKSHNNNIKIDDSPKEESDLLKGYNESLAVLVPLHKDTGSMTGITVVLEAFAFSKPVISTKSKYYPFDIEKEGCGIYVDYGDTQGWIKAMQFLNSNPEIAKEMGLKGRKLLEDKFNYKLFCNEIDEIIRDGNQKKNWN